MQVKLPLREANLLRKRIRAIVFLSDPFFKRRGQETVHDLRVSSRRLHELLEYLQPSLPEQWFLEARKLAARIRKSLGTLREAEANLKILQEWYRENKSEAAVLELMIRSQRRILRVNRKAAHERISRKKFQKLNKMLLEVKGVRAMESNASKSVDARIEEFASFEWHPQLDDMALHDLRVCSKKLRYALEIYNELHPRMNLAFPVERIREFQEVLGQIHDLAILEIAVEQEKEEWDAYCYQMIPAALERLGHQIVREKQNLYSSVFPFHTRALENLRAHFKTTMPLLSARWKVEAG